MSSITEQTFSSNHHTHAAYVMNFLNGCFDESIDEYFLRVGDGERFADAGKADLITDTLIAQMLQKEIEDFFIEKNSNEYNLIHCYLTDDNEIVVVLIRY